MDFDYQKLKDAESQEREERLGSLPVHHPMPKPRQCLDSEMQVTTVTVKRIAPALVLGPLGTLEALSPSLRAYTLLWFERTQLPRLRTPGNSLPCWLHGFATRREAEQLLQDKPQGCFLLRLSESKIGFALSYRGEDRCRHFIIEEEDSETFGSVYLIAGEDSRHHSLEDLINYYTHNPVGPFNEMLTVSCNQPNGDREEIDKLGMKNQEGDRKYENGKVISQDEQTKLAIAAGPAVLDSLPTNSNHITSTRDETVQYAAVRKPLKKTASLPECKCGPDTAPPTVENGSSELAERPYNPSVTLDQTHPPEAPYARVNKPPRAASENMPNASAPSELQGATAASVPPSLTNFDTMAADQKYCKFEPMHTYEETIHTRRRDEDEEIDCYAMGWRRQATGNAVELPRHHVYSEVNIRGAQESNAVSSRPTPSLPLRPPPRSAHAALRTESSGQSFGLPPLMVQPRHSDFHHSHNASSSSIYERIPERPSSSRPSLPPPNPKR
ncbi:SH2 domain-containing protein 2A [Triplophysa rosa]|uniref:SH2 domain-containing protein 2A n=1 Tax=Triplophysa rosa TaxID=992332 RepID=UPI002545FD5A|nr:SH2 domain-containing protein 2A [Triplophysa rosa]